MSSSKELIVNGYIHANTTKYLLVIPNDVIVIILMYIKTKCELYRIGEAEEFGSKEPSLSKSPWSVGNKKFVAGVYLVITC